MTKIIKRYNKLYKENINNNIFYKVYIFIDILISYILYGSSVGDYFLYEFYKKKNIERKKFITFKKHKRIQKIFNVPEDCYVLTNKNEFNTLFANYVKREWLYIKRTSLEDFKQFCIKHKEIILKPNNSSCGYGIEKIKIENEKDIIQLYEKIKDKEFMVEEKIKQKGLLSEFNPLSVNTVRITTCNSGYSKGNVRIMNAVLRMGCGNRVVDNFSHEGIIANINIETGIIDTYAMNKNKEKFIYHPITKKQILGVKIPFWDEAIETVKEASLLVPGIRYIGWDVVIKEKGDIELIEANNGGGHDVQQFNQNEGKWYLYKDLINDFLKSKKQSTAR